MKKIYLLMFVCLSGGFVMAQTTKTTKKQASKKAIAVTPAQTTTDAFKAQPSIQAAPVAEHKAGDGHNHGMVAPAVDVAKPIGEDNLALTETTYDFGKVKQGIPVYHDFTFKNSGKTELKLDNVVAGCGCTTPEWKPGPYKPGESAVIKVGFNAGAVGPTSKSVTITYNGGLTKVISFTVDVQAAPATPAPENKGVQMLKAN